MKIELLYTGDCTHYKIARRLIHDTLKSLNLNYPLKKVETKTAEDAKTHLFGGSPTVRIDGENVEPETVMHYGFWLNIFAVNSYRRGAAEQMGFSIFCCLGLHLFQWVIEIERFESVVNEPSRDLIMGTIPCV